jgi:hypothetical protein
MHDFTILVMAENAADRDDLTADLEACLKGFHQSVEAERTGAGKGTQDAGAVIGVVLSSAAIVAVARGIAAWLRMRQSAELVVECKKSGVKVSAKRLTATTAQSAIEATLAACQEMEATETSKNEKQNVSKKPKTPPRGKQHKKPKK